MDDWVRVYRHELDEHGVDPDRLLEETHERERERAGDEPQAPGRVPRADRAAREERA